MQRIPSGVTDQYIYFFMVDATDKTTPETGLSSFTVRRSRNGGASAAFTTPTVNETDVTNMPGWYELLMDEDTTLDSGDNCQMMALHITHAGADPAKVIVEIYRPAVSAGETITVSSGAVSNVTTTATATAVTTVNGLASGVITATSIAADAIGASELAADAATEIATAVWATATRSLTVLDEDSTTLDLDATIRSAVGLASADLDTQLGALPTAAENADAVWDEDATAHQTQGTFGQAIGDPGADTDTIFGLINTNLDATVSSRASQTSVDTIDDLLDTEIAALTTAVADLPTNAELATALGTADDATLAAIAAVDTKIDTLTTNVGTVDTVLDALVADIGSNGSGLTAIPWNSSWDVEVESEVTDALTTYDVATVADVGGGGGGGATADEVADEIETRILNVNIVQVNEIPINGAGTDEDTWGPV